MCNHCGCKGAEDFESHCAGEHEPFIPEGETAQAESFEAEVAYPVEWEDVRRDMKYPKEDNNNGLIYGIEYMDGEMVSDVEWFATAKERDAELKSYIEEFGAETFEATGISDYTVMFMLGYLDQATFVDAVRYNDISASELKRYVNKLNDAFGGYEGLVEYFNIYENEGEDVANFFAKNMKETYKRDGRTLTQYYYFDDDYTKEEFMRDYRLRGKDAETFEARTYRRGARKRPQGMRNSQRDAKMRRMRKMMNQQRMVASAEGEKNHFPVKVISYSVNVHKDDYEQGEIGDAVHYWRVDVNDLDFDTKAENEEELLQILNSIIRYEIRGKVPKHGKDDFGFEISNNFIYKAYTDVHATYEEGQGMGLYSYPTEYQKEAWKRGEFELDSLGFIFDIEDVDDFYAENFESQIEMAKTSGSDLGYVAIKGDDNKTTAIVDVMTEDGKKKGFDVSIKSPTDEFGEGGEETLIRFNERGMFDVMLAEEFDADHPEHSVKGKVRTMSGKPHSPRKMMKDMNISPEEAAKKMKLEADMDLKESAKVGFGFIAGLTAFRVAAFGVAAIAGRLLGNNNNS